MSRTTISIWIIFLVVLLPGRESIAADYYLDCDQKASLVEVTDCIRTSMRDRDDGYSLPSQEEIDAFGFVVASMMAGQCTDIPIPSALAADYKLTEYVDQQLHDRTYCLFWEHRDVTNDGDYDVENGLGTFIYYPEALNEVVVTVPHAIFETPTTRQGTDLFQRAQSRALLLVGVHRYASSELSACQSSLYDPNWPSASEHVTSDAAHNQDAFLRAQQEVHQHYLSQGVPYHNIQLHGMGTSSCPQHVYIANGSNWPVLGKALDLVANMAAKYPDWIIGFRGDGGEVCLDGSSNTFARWAGNVEDICAYGADGPAVHEFVHIEQDRYRDPVQETDLIRDGLKWTPAIIEEFNDPLACITGGQGDPGNSKIHCDEYTPCCSGLGHCEKVGRGRNAYMACKATETLLCGNGVIDPGEECDGNNLGGQSCETLDQGFSSGILACTAECSLDTSGCTGGMACVDSGGSCSNNNDCCEGLTCSGKGRNKTCQLK